MTNLIKLRYNINKLCWWIINIVLVFTAFLKPITAASNLALLLLFLNAYQNFNSDTKRFTFIYGSVILILVGYSFILQNNFSYIVRFALILFFIGVSYYIKLKLAILIPPLKFTAIIFSCLLIFGEIYLLFFFDKSILPTLRYYVTSNGLGDIYPKYGNFFAIQLVGSAALPFVFILSYVVKIFKRNKLCRFLLLSGIIIAGNFAFIIAIAFFWVSIHLSKKISYKRLINYFIFAVAVGIVIGPYAYSFVSDTLESKKEMSNAIRKDQAIVLMDDMSKTSYGFLLGQGLGNTLDVKTKFRDYTDNVYFELQSVYFLNQLGIIFFFSFIVLNIWLTYKYIKGKQLVIAYISFILYAITNPYILNTNQVVVIITLVSLSHGLREKRQYEDLSNEKESGSVTKYDHLRCCGLEELKFNLKRFFNDKHWLYISSI